MTDDRGVESASEPSAATAAVPSDAPITGVVVGTRLCARCGYNLSGQIIRREPRYHLLVVMCPECGTVSPMIEYPSLSPWITQVHRLLTSLWVLLLLVLLAATAVPPFAFALGSSAMMGERYDDAVRHAFNASGTTRPFSDWWSTADRGAILADAGGAGGLFGPEVVTLLLLQLPVMVLMGMVWSVLLVGKGWFTRLVWALVLIAVAAAYVAIPALDWYLEDTFRSASEAGRAYVGSVVAPLSLAWSFVILLPGMAVGPVLARGLVRVTVPPKLIPSLGFLWTECGLDPPVIRPDRR